jgi:hypothetical protein
MDGSTLPAPLYTALGYLIALAIATAVFKSPWFKGEVGEAVVNLAARLFLDKSRYHLVKTSPSQQMTAPHRSITSSSSGTACSWRLDLR